jgi:hypothetical protein
MNPLDAYEGCKARRELMRGFMHPNNVARGATIKRVETGGLEVTIRFYDPGVGAGGDPAYTALDLDVITTVLSNTFREAVDAWKSVVADELGGEQLHARGQAIAFLRELGFQPTPEQKP